MQANAIDILIPSGLAAGSTTITATVNGSSAGTLQFNVLSGAPNITSAPAVVSPGETITINGDNLPQNVNGGPNYVLVGNLVVSVTASVAGWTFQIPSSIQTATPIIAVVDGIFSGPVTPGWQLATKTSSAIALTSLPNPSVYGAGVALTATVTSTGGGTPTGTIQFFADGNLIASVPPVAGSATTAISTLNPGSNFLMASYSGDSNYFGSTSRVLLQIVKATPVVTLATSGTPITQGAPVTFTATLSSDQAAAPTGTVTFYDGTTVIGTAQMGGATATTTTSALTAGTHSITAAYAGDTNFAAATSSAIQEVVEGSGLPGSGIITTVAGNGIRGDSGDGGVATGAELDLPLGLLVDASGNLDIAVGGYVRRVDGHTGIITPIAGNGNLYSSGGSATSTGVGRPAGLALDASGNMYIGDIYDYRVLKLSTSGTVTSVAGNGTQGYGGDGGSATSPFAYIGIPEGVALDASGNIFMADGYVVRKVSSAGILSTVAGNQSYSYSGDGGPATSAGIDLPLGVSVDASGNIYIADSGNNVIRKVNTSGVITTVVGNGIAGYLGDGSPATSAELNDPQAVYVDMAGNIYIADSGNNRIRKVNTSGVITTVAGNGTAGYSGDGGLAVNAALNSPEGVYVDANGTLYISDSSNNRVRAVGPTANTLGITVTTSGSPSLYGSAVTFTATVPNGDTNAVTFYSGSHSLGTALPSGGTASINTSSLAVGVNAITASIAAGGSYPAATSDVLDQTVNPLTSTISISNIPTAAGYGGSFTALYNYAGDGEKSVSSSTPSVCGTSDSTVTFLSVGTCTLVASALASADYGAATGSAQSFTVNPPMISSLSPTSGPESTPVTISGIGFGFSPSTTSVAFNGTVANISSWSNTSIVANVPIGAMSGNVVVKANGTASNGVLFTVQATSPTIVSLSPSSGNVGLAVTISGSGFGATEGQNTVTFSNVPAGVLNWTDTSITAIVPSSASTGPVVVHLFSNSQTSNTDIVFTIPNTTSCTL